MTEILEKFNSTLLKFLNEIDTLYPDSQAKSYHNMINMALKVDKKIWINYFADEAIKHNVEIMSKNENYFLNGDLKFVKKLNLDHYYSISTDETKENIWKYVIALYLLSCTYKGYNNDVINVVQKISKENNCTSSKAVMEQLKKMN